MTRNRVVNEFADFIQRSFALSFSHTFFQIATGIDETFASLAKAILDKRAASGIGQEKRSGFVLKGDDFDNQKKKSCCG